MFVGFCCALLRIDFIYFYFVYLFVLMAIIFFAAPLVLSLVFFEESARGFDEVKFLSLLLSTLLHANSSAMDIKSNR